MYKKFTLKKKERCLIINEDSFIEKQRKIEGTLIASEYLKFQSRIPFVDKKFPLKSLYGVVQSPNNLPRTK